MPKSLFQSIRIASLIHLVFIIVSCGGSRSSDILISSLGGLYRVETTDDTFYLWIDEATSNKHFCFSEKMLNGDSVAIHPKENQLYATKTDEPLFKLSKKGDEIIVTWLKNRSCQGILKKANNHPETTARFIEDTKRYLEPRLSININKDQVVYDNKPGFYESLPIDTIPPCDYQKYIQQAVKRYKATALARGVEPLNLKMDIYYPASNEGLKHPVILMAHGGAFLFGDKQGALMQRLADYFTHRGYVVASLNYRLGCSFLGIPAIERSIYRSVQDIRTATRYLIERAETYQIDTTSIFYLGHSAGAVAAITACFMKNREAYSSISANWIRSDLGKLPPKTQIRGLVGLWGGITDLNLIEADEKVAALLIHGDMDDIIPFYSGTPFKCVTGDFIHIAGNEFFKIYGSAAIAQRMEEEALDCRLYVFEDEKHDPHLGADGAFNQHMITIEEKIRDFLYQRLLDIDVHTDAALTGIYSKLYTISESQNITVIDWKVIGGTVIQQNTPNVVEIFWFSNARKRVCIVTIQTSNGIVMKKRCVI